MLVTHTSPFAFMPHLYSPVFTNCTSYRFLAHVFPAPHCTRFSKLIAVLQGCLPASVSDFKTNHSALPAALHPANAVIHHLTYRPVQQSVTKSRKVGGDSAGLHSHYVMLLDKMTRCSWLHFRSLCLICLAVMVGWLFVLLSLVKGKIIFWNSWSAKELCFGALTVQARQLWEWMRSSVYERSSNYAVPGASVPIIAPFGVIFARLVTLDDGDTRPDIRRLAYAMRWDYPRRTSFRRR